MGRKKVIQIGESPAWPTNAQVKEYASAYRKFHMNPISPQTSFHLFNHTQKISVLLTWGVRDIFFAYAYPPAGFVIENPEDVAKLDTFDGYIIEYSEKINGFNVLVRSSKDGMELFQSEKRRYKPS